MNQFSSTNITVQHEQQRTLSSINMPNTEAHHSIMHSNMNQQQVVVSSFQPSTNTTAPSHLSMTNPTGSSTPIPAPSKSGRNNTSGISENNVQLIP
jgi:hypothetical protein